MAARRLSRLQREILAVLVAENADERPCDYLTLYRALRKRGIKWVSQSLRRSLRNLEAKGLIEVGEIEDPRPGSTRKYHTRHGTVAEMAMDGFGADYSERVYVLSDAGKAVCVACGMP